VPQDDLLFEDLTVWENLYFNASLCFDQLPSQAIEEKVEKVLHELELHAFKDLKVGQPFEKNYKRGSAKKTECSTRTYKGTCYSVCR
jgi:ABC transport system ATP-binding/permease protein